MIDPKRHQKYLNIVPQSQICIDSPAQYVHLKPFPVNISDHTAISIKIYHNGSRVFEKHI
jgi:hypothetical protein